MNWRYSAGGRSLLTRTIGSWLVQPAWSIRSYITRLTAGYNGRPRNGWPLVARLAARLCADSGPENDSHVFAAAQRPMRRPANWLGTGYGRESCWQRLQHRHMKLSTGFAPSFPASPGGRSDRPRDGSVADAGGADFAARTLRSPCDVDHEVRTVKGIKEIKDIKIDGADRNKGGGFRWR
jgi:hypothetical protein